MRYCFANLASRTLVSIWLIVPMLMFSAPSESASTIQSFSRACAGSFSDPFFGPGFCLYDSQSGDPAISSASHIASFVEGDGRGGINYSAKAAGSGVPGQFSADARRRCHYDDRLRRGETGHPVEMRSSVVARASRPCWNRSHGQDARVTTQS